MVRGVRYIYIYIYIYTQRERGGGGDGVNQTDRQVGRQIIREREVDREKEESGD